MKITLCGVDFDLEFTVEVQKKMEERFGRSGKEAVEKMLDSTDYAEFQGNMAFMGCHMANASEHRKAVRAKMVGQEYSPREDLREEDFYTLLKPGDIPELTRVVLEAMKEGNAQKVEVKPSKKNVKATPSG